jgi:hypothetical protein
MPRRKKPSVAPVVAADESQEVSPADASVQGRILERPDGFYWESKESEALRGPFASRAEAEADLLAGGSASEEFEAEETLQEAESELGISDWIDPDTGGPAEDNVPHIEDH